MLFNNLIEYNEERQLTGTILQICILFKQKLIFLFLYLSWYFFCRVRSRVEPEILQITFNRFGWSHYSSLFSIASWKVLRHCLWYGLNDILAYADIIFTVPFRLLVFLLIYLYPVHFYFDIYSWAFGLWPLAINILILLHFIARNQFHLVTLVYGSGYRRDFFKLIWLTASWRLLTAGLLS